jgi:hypothetical protein
LARVYYPAAANEQTVFRWRIGGRRVRHYYMLPPFGDCR